MASFGAVEHLRSHLRLAGAQPFRVHDTYRDPCAGAVGQERVEARSALRLSLSDEEPALEAPVCCVLYLFGAVPAPWGALLPRLGPPVVSRAFLQSADSFDFWAARQLRTTPA